MVVDWYYKVFNHLSDNTDFWSIYQTTSRLGHLKAERIPGKLGHDHLVPSDRCDALSLHQTIQERERTSEIDSRSADLIFKFTHKDLHTKLISNVKFGSQSAA